MSLKIFSLLAILVSASVSMASTTVECAGNGKSFKVDFNQIQTGEVQTAAKFGNSPKKMAYLPQAMEIEVTIFPAGSFYSDKEVRSYTGTYITDDLSLGFTVAQAFDAQGNMISELKNVFGMNKESIGSCKVTNN